MLPEYLHIRVMAATLRHYPWPVELPQNAPYNEIPYVINCLCDGIRAPILNNPEIWRAACWTVDFHLSFKGSDVDGEFGYGPLAYEYFEAYLT